MYDIGFQRSVVYLCASDYRFACDYGTLISKGAFDTQPLNVVFNLVIGYATTYEKEISLDECMILVQDHVERRSLDSGNFELLKNEVTDVFKTDITNEQFIKDKLVEFQKRSNLRGALEKAVRRLEVQEAANFDDIPKLMEDAINIEGGKNLGKTGNDLIDLLPSLRQKYDPSKLVKTGYPSFDSAFGGGYAPGELHVIMAPPKSGKSTLGCNIGAMSLLYSHNVFHISLEISEEEVLAKYAVKFSQLKYSELLSVSQSEYESRMKKFMTKKDNLFVKHFEEGTVSAATVKSWISRVRAKYGKHPGLIIVDYDDCLIPANKAKDGPQDMYNESGSIYSDLISLAKYFKCPVLTFAQPTRETWSSVNDGNLIYSSNISHSGRKVHRATSISSLCFPKGQEFGLLFLDMNRRGDSFVKVPMRRDLSRGAFVEASQGEYEQALQQWKNTRNNRN